MARARVRVGGNPKPAHHLLLLRGFRVYEVDFGGEIPPLERFVRFFVRLGIRGHGYGVPFSAFKVPKKVISFR